MLQFDEYLLFLATPLVRGAAALYIDSQCAPGAQLTANGLASVIRSSGGRTRCHTVLRSVRSLNHSRIALSRHGPGRGVLYAAQDIFDEADVNNDGMVRTQHLNHH